MGMFAFKRLRAQEAAAAQAAAASLPLQQDPAVLEPKRRGRPKKVESDEQGNLGQSDDED